MTTLATSARFLSTRTRPFNKPIFGLEGLEQRALMAADLMGGSIVFMADNVADQGELARAFPGAEVIRLDSRRDVLGQVSQALAGRSGLSSIQFVTHGESGTMNLGSGGQVLNAQALEAAAGTVKSWGRALADDGDIVLWGCDIGQGKQGRAFVSKLSFLTGADVAASSNRTGSSRLGADWNLEVKTGRIESTAKFITPFAYGFTLAAPTISGASAGQAVNENNTIRPFNPVVIASETPATVLSVSISLDTAAKGDFTAGSLASSGFGAAGGGMYTFSGTAAQATTAVARLVFQPTQNRVNTGSTETSTFTISASNGVDPAATCGFVIRAACWAGRGR